MRDVWFWGLVLIALAAIIVDRNPSPLADAVWWGAIGLAALLLVWRLVRGTTLASRVDALDAAGAALADESSEYAVAKLSSFPDLDLEWYARTTEELEKVGLRLLGDVVNAKHNRQNPHSATVIRTLLSPDGEIVGGLYHLKVRGGMRHLLPVQSAEHRSFDFETELDNGEFIATSNATAAAAISVSPLVHRTFVDASVSATEAFEVHRDAVTRYLAAHPGVSTRPCQTLEDVSAFQARLQATKARYRQQLGGRLMRQELERIAGDEHQDAARILSDEVERRAREAKD